MATLMPLPAVAVAGAETAKCVAAAPATAIEPDVPARVAVTVSTAASVWAPAVLRTAENVPVPLGKTALAGRVAGVLPLVKCTVPEYDGIMELAASSAVTVNCKDVPAVALLGAETAKCTDAPLETPMPADVPVMDDVAESGAVRL